MIHPRNNADLSRQQHRQSRPALVSGRPVLPATTLNRDNLFKVFDEWCDSEGICFSSLLENSMKFHRGDKYPASQVWQGSLLFRSSLWSLLGDDKLSGCQKGDFATTTSDGVGLRFCLGEGGATDTSHGMSLANFVGSREHGFTVGLEQRSRYSCYDLGRSFEGGRSYCGNAP